MYNSMTYNKKADSERQNAIKQTDRKSNDGLKGQTKGSAYKHSIRHSLVLMKTHVRCGSDSKIVDGLAFFFATPKLVRHRRIQAMPVGGDFVDGLPGEEGGNIERGKLLNRVLA